jgi:hypothetical protein
VNPADVLDRLEAIEKDMAEKQNEYETVAEARARLVRDWDKRLAIHGKTAKGSSADVRKATALAGAIEQDQLYERLSDAEARFEALKVVMRTLETRATIGQSLLRAMGRGA